MNNIEQKKSEYDSLIIGYLTDSITEEEKGILKRWIESDKMNESYYVAFQEAWIIGGAEKEMGAFNVQPAWEVLNQQMYSKRNFLEKAEKRRLFFKYLRMAASWLIIFSLGLSAMYLFQGNPEYIPSKPVLISVPLGARGTIVLPDGTKIWLNAGTQITYNQDYGTKTRTLDLTGEAYFDVAKDRKHPFVVNVSGLKIRALGTKFNVKAYPEERDVLATLEEGKIDVEVVKSGSKTKSIVLLPNENIVFQKSSQAIEKSYPEEQVKIIDEPKTESSIRSVTTGKITVIKDVNTELFTSWKEERWIIEGEPLGTLAPMLERRFNKKIQFKDEELKGYNFTGTIENETIEQIMDAVKLTAPVDFRINKDVIILTSDSAMRDQFRELTKSSEK